MTYDTSISHLPSIHTFELNTSVAVTIHSLLVLTQLITLLSLSLHLSLTLSTQPTFVRHSRGLDFVSRISIMILI